MLLFIMNLIFACFGVLHSVNFEVGDDSELGLGKCVRTSSE